MSNQEINCPDKDIPDKDDAEFQKELETNFKILPLFERQYRDYTLTKQYCMSTNEKLRKRWHEVVRACGSGSKPGSMKTMPNINDYHFHNSRTKFLPSESRWNVLPPRKHLAPGPGVDKYGQRPIPDDMMQELPGRKGPTGPRKPKPPNKGLHVEK